MSALSPASQFVYSRLGSALTDPDHSHGDVLRALVETLVSPLDVVESAIGADGGAMPLLSPKECPVVLLPWLAQLVGVTLPVGFDESTGRALVMNPPSWRAGSPQAIVDAVKGWLSGSRRVDVVERAHPDRPGQDAPWHLVIVVYADEVPSSLDSLVQDVRAVTDAELQFTVVVRSGWTFNDMAASGLTFREAARLSGARLKHIVPGTPIEEIRRMR